MAEVQQTRWDRIIRRVSGSVGTRSHVSETLSELFPVIDVERVPAELLALGGTKLASGRSLEAGVASNFQRSQIRNPGGSTNIITVLQITAFSSVAQGLGLGITLNSNANLNPANTAYLDGRLLASSVPVGEVRDGIGLVADVDFFQIRSSATQSIDYRPPRAAAVLSPGTSFSVTTTVANTLLLCSFLWIERPAEPSELSL